MDYENIIHSLVDSFVVDKDAVMIRQVPSDNENEVTLLVVANPDDTARMIGRKGTIANALREVVSVAGKSEGKRIFLKFESFEAQNEDED